MLVVFTRGNERRLQVTDAELSDAHGLRTGHRSHQADDCLNAYLLSYAV